ncbi:unnamed protein product (macronuclear) [Paramecium tetraurelia]|uniref:START domain-containing protein n=1 Tax=Paramecium tetraurelia TaxID=5888 RepID=A0BTD6_PARTE|nr:uncharacterized protein GSPATT00032035001 [Paramecium tetraurelia]CAK61803.1 unnamed protein product [Paramecium tetraurelia]|eukprot:XP_001429201.1 hypothetical protein (macronuclear) [Paramecium tetraurelia strain d4-2]
MSLFANYARLKRKTFWVMRYIEVTQEGILVYRDRKEDKQNKAELKLIHCKVKELSTNNGFQIQIIHGDDSLKIMTHTNQEHKIIVQAITQIKQKSEQKQEIQVQAQEQFQQVRQTIVPSIIIQQVKPPTFQPDNDLIKQSQGDQIKVQAQQLIKKFESQQLTLINVIDGIFFYKTEKAERNNEEAETKSNIMSLISDEIKNVGYLLTIAIAIIFFTLLSILVYLLLSLVDNRTYTYSILITLNIVILPLLFKKHTPPKQTEKVQQFMVQCKCLMNVDYNALVYLISKFDVRKEWTPNLLLINNDKNLITALYSNQLVEKFTQTVFYDEDTFYVVEHFHVKILRLFVIKYLFDEDSVEVRCIADSTQMQILPCLKQFIKIQKQNPKSILIEYQASKTSGDQMSVIQSEIIYKQSDYSRITQSPNQSISVEQQPPSLPSNSPRQISQQLQLPQKPQQPSQLQQLQQPQQPQQSYPPEIQKIFDMTIEAKKQLESVYPLGPSWQQKEDKGGFLIHTRFDEATGQTMSRGEGILPYTIQEIFEIIEKVEKRGDYDSLFDSGYMVKRLDGDTGIVYQRFKTIKIVVKIKRFCVCIESISRRKQVGGYSKINRESVRGDLKIAGWILQKADQGTKTCFITMVDPKGSIPAAIVASSAKEQGQCVEKVKALLDKRNKK